MGIPSINNYVSINFHQCSSDRFAFFPRFFSILWMFYNFNGDRAKYSGVWLNTALSFVLTRATTPSYFVTHAQITEPLLTFDHPSSDKQTFSPFNLSRHFNMPSLWIFSNNTFSNIFSFARAHIIFSIPCSVLYKTIN